MTPHRLLRGLAAALALAGLGACTAQDLTANAAQGFKSWCRNAPNCTVHEEQPGDPPTP